jgi:hypothetical protein
VNRSFPLSSVDRSNAGLRGFQRGEHAGDPPCPHTASSTKAVSSSGAVHSPPGTPAQGPGRTSSSWTWPSLLEAAPHLFSAASCSCRLLFHPLVRRLRRRRRIYRHSSRRRLGGLLSSGASACVGQELPSRTRRARRKRVPVIQRHRPPRPLGASRVRRFHSAARRPPRKS